MAFVNQLINEAIAPLQSPVSLNMAGTITGTNLMIQNSNFSTTTPSRNADYPAFSTQYGMVGISYRGSNDASLNIATLVIQYKQMDNYSLLLFCSASDLSDSVFDMLADGQVKCMKALLVQSKVAKLHLVSICTVPIKHQVPL